MTLIFEFNVAMAVGGVLLLFMQQQRGWLAADVSPRACLRFWRNSLSRMLTLTFRGLKKSFFAEWLD